MREQERARRGAPDYPWGAELNPSVPDASGGRIVALTLGERFLLGAKQPLLRSQDEIIFVETAAIRLAFLQRLAA